MKATRQNLQTSRPIFFHPSSRFAVVYQLFCSRTTTDRLYYDWITEKNLVGLETGYWLIIPLAIITLLNVWLYCSSSRITMRPLTSSDWLDSQHVIITQSCCILALSFDTFVQADLSLLKRRLPIQFV